MITVVLVIHLIIAIALVGVILLQRSEGGALGIGGGGGGGGLVSGRAAGNLLTRSTAILAGCFFVTSLALAILSGDRGEGTSILEETVPAEAGEAPALAVPAPTDEPQAPAAPLAQ